MIIHIVSVIFDIHFSTKDTMQKEYQSDFLIVEEFTFIFFFKILFWLDDRSLNLIGNTVLENEQPLVAKKDCFVAWLPSKCD